MSTIEKDFTIKISILFLATFAGIFAIWYALIREESVDWVSAQISHQSSYYAITEIDTGLAVSNVLIGYDFNLPKGFKAIGIRNLNIYIEEGGLKKCEIKHSYLNANKARGLVDNETKLIIPLRQQVLVFELLNKAEKDDCGKYLREIKNSLVID